MAYENNISPGTPPLLWSNIKSAFDQINENFTVLGSALARNTPFNIAHVELSVPVRIVTTTDHSYTSASQATITETGISQLDNNTYYIKVVSSDEVELYNDESLSSEIDGTTFDAYSSGGGKIQTLSEFASIDFDNLHTNVGPAETNSYQLGDFDASWKRLHLSPYLEIVGSELNGLWLGSAHVIDDGTAVVLPENSKVGTELIIDPLKTFWKTINVDQENVVQATIFADDLSFNSGIAMQIVVDSSEESLTFNNTGVTSLIAGTGTSISAATGDITVTNTGVITLTNSSVLPSGLPAGSGISASSATGNISITNTGVIDIQNGFGITVSRDDATGIVTVTNNAPAQVAYKTVRVAGSDDLEADSTADTLVVEAGYGMVVTTSEIVEDTLVLSVDPNIDIIGSVFANDSSIIVDSIDQRVFASGGLVGDTTGYHTGDVKGSVFGDDSTIIVDAVENKVFAEFFGNITGNVTGNVSGNVSGDVSGNVTGNAAGDHTGTFTGNVFTTLIDSADSSAITVTPATIFSSDVTVENELFIGASRVIAVAELKTVVAASIDFADFQARIAAL